MWVSRRSAVRLLSTRSLETTLNVAATKSVEGFADAEPLTNAQIATRLGRDPASVLHHVRTLTADSL